MMIHCSEISDVHTSHIQLQRAFRSVRTMYIHAKPHAQAIHA